MSVTPTLTLDPSWGAKRQTEALAWETLLGDGYEQLAVGGAPSIRESWDIQSTGYTWAEAEALVNELSAYAGAREFLWSPDAATPAKAYTCKEWTVVPIGARGQGRQNLLYRIEARFEEYPLGQCEEFRAEIDEQQILGWLQGSLNWLNTYTRDTQPLIMNSSYVLVNAFHSVLGRGGYFPPSAGTTEGQFLGIKAAIAAYEETGVQGWLTLAQNMAAPLASVFYGHPLPSNGTTYLAPHWLVNVKEPFTSKGLVSGDPLSYGHFDVEVSFSGGVGVIPGGQSGSLLSDVFSVFSLDGKLLWQNVYSPVFFGTEYEVEYWVSDYLLGGQRYRVYPTTASSSGTPPTPTSEAAGTVKLVSSYSGALKIVYASYTGPVIPINTGFEAYPVWRSLRPGEAQVALDTLWWADTAYADLYHHTGNAQWLNARDSNQYSMLLASVIPNLTHWYKPEDSTDEFAYPGSQVIEANSTGRFTTSRQSSAGDLNNFLRIAVSSVPASTFPSIEFQNFAVQAIISPTTDVRVQVAHTNGGLIEVSVSTSTDPFDFSQTYAAFMLVDASSSTFTSRLFSAHDLIRWDSYLVWWPRAADNPVYTYDDNGGSASWGLASASDIGNGSYTHKSVVAQINLDASGGGYAGAGLVVIHAKPTRPPRLMYRLDGDDLVIKLTDQNGSQWTSTLEATGGSYARFAKDWSDFTRAAGSGAKGSAPITGVEFQADNGASGTLRVWWASENTDRLEPELLPAEVRTYKASIVSRDPSAFTMWVGEFRPVGSPSDEITYNPGVIPFTANSINGVIEAWRGIPLVGYQSPYTWAKWGEESRLQQVLDFLKAAQDHYAKVIGVHGPFAPAYSWNFWDNGEYLANGLNGFGWEAPDPSTDWEGYMHRIVEDLCNAWRLRPGNAQIAQLASSFLSWYDSFLSANNNDPPTNYGRSGPPQKLYECPHAAALMLRAAVYANLAGGAPETTFRIIYRSLKYLERSYVATGTMAGSFAGLQPAFTEGSFVGNEMFGFWALEVVESLAVLLRYKDSLRLPACSVPLQ